MDALLPFVKAGCPSWVEVDPFTSAFQEEGASFLDDEATCQMGATYQDVVTFRGVAAFQDAFTSYGAAAFLEEDPSSFLEEEASFHEEAFPSVPCPIAFLPLEEAPSSFLAN